MHSTQLFLFSLQLFSFVFHFICFDIKLFEIVFAGLRIWIFNFTITHSKRGNLSISLLHILQRLLQQTIFLLFFLIVVFRGSKLDWDKQWTLKTFCHVLVENGSMVSLRLPTISSKFIVPISFFFLFSYSVTEAFLRRSRDLVDINVLVKEIFKI